MFLHNFKYTLKTLFKNKALIFWTFAFPIILGTFFTLAFSNIEKNEQLDTIDIAIIEQDEFENNKIYKENLEKISIDDEHKMFNIKYISEEDAKELLQKREISGYLLLKETPEIVVATNGVNETIFKFVVDEIKQSEQKITNIINKKISDFRESNPTMEITFDDKSLYNEAYSEMMKSQEKVTIKNITRSNLSYTMIEFYSLIAMTCLYGGIIGMTAINQILPNMSHNGKRVGVSPKSKWSLILSSVLASFIVQLIGIIILFAYTIFVLNISYGNNFLHIILLSLVGCLAGLSFGVMVATVFKTNENTKTGIILALTMFGSVLSGMMGITMKYVIDKNIPFLNKINPVNMITDGLYSLYYYTTFDRFYFNLISLIIFSCLSIGISVLVLRRQKYDSI